MSDDSPCPLCVGPPPEAQDSRTATVYACMRFLAVFLTMSVGLGCGGASGREARSADEENSEEIAEPQSEESADPESAESDEDREERNANEGARPAKKRKPKRRRHVEATPQPEPPPMYRKPIPPPEPPPVEEPAPEPAAAYADGTDQGDNALETEARKRCRWKNVAPYRPDWANSISPPLAQQRKITSKPICPYGTPPAVLRVARQIAVQQTKLKR